MINTEHIILMVEKSGRSLNSVEKELGFGNGAIKRWSKNSPSVSKLYSLADLLSVSLSELLGEENSSSKLTEEEHWIIDSYRELDVHGKNLVKGEISKQYIRMTEMQTHDSSEFAEDMTVEARRSSS